MTTHDVQAEPSLLSANDGPVLAELRGSVLLLSLNRPEKMNAWTQAMEMRYFDLLDAAERDPEVRAIVLTGIGRGFCAGADFDDIKAVSGSDLSALQHGRPAHHPLSVSKPIVAAINGPAAGVGLVQTLYCDVRISSARVKLTTAFARRGLIAEYGSAWLLPRLVGRGAALDLLLSGRIFLGQEAHAMGLVNRITEPEDVLDTALAYAADLAENCSPTSISVIKTQVQLALDSSFNEAVEHADAEMRESFMRPDVKEGVDSYLEKRPPAFPGVRVSR
jgi:enoyl-CoA hydratase/carnithine racemase